MARKRNAREGSIFERSDGRWCAQLDLGWEGGKRRRKYVYGATAAEVQEQLLKARTDLAAGLPVVVERQTVAQFLQDWLEDSVKPSVRPLTHEQYHQHVKLYLAPLLGHHRLAKLAPQHVRAFLKQKLADGLSPRTVQLSLVILRKALGQAVKDGVIARNVAKLVDAPRWKRPEVKPWEPSEASRFLEAIKSERLEVAYLVALSLGPCASFLLAQGVHPRVVMELLGHSQISLTMDTYSHVMSNAMREAVASVGALLGK